MMRVKGERGERESAGRPSNSSGRRSVRGENADDNVDATPTPMPTQSQSFVDLEDNRPKTTDPRELRLHYRELRSKVNGQSAYNDIEEFKAIVERAGKLHQQVKKPRESIVDAEIFSELTTGVLNIAKSALVKGGMSAAEFVGAVIHTYGLPGSADEDPGQSIDWEALGLEACAILRHAPGVSTMVGPMDVEIKVRKTTGPKRRERPADKTRPESVKEVDADRPNTETDANMSTMFRIVTERQEVKLDHLVLNRVSFAQTIENLFALSFLVKDGRVEIRFDDKKVQFVVPKNAPAHAERVAGDVKNTQFVFRLDFKCWRLMVETVPEGQELMPHRGNAETSPVTVPAARTPIRKNSRNRARETPAVTAPGESPEDSSEQSQRLKRRLLSTFA